MTLQNPKACTLKVGQLEKNPILALSTNAKEVAKYELVTKSYGSVTPAIVGKIGNAYQILAGQASLEACAMSGLQEMPVVVAAKMCNEAEQLKLALLLSTVHEKGNPLAEGMFIDALLTDHGVTRRELMVLLNKSKSWLSKRHSLATRLAAGVKEMVKSDIICPRSAEEIAKLPVEIQIAFASTVAKEGLSKADVGQLVSLYIASEPDSVVQTAILNIPLAVLDTYPSKKSSAGARSREKRGLAEQLADNIGFLLRLSVQLKELMAKADPQSLLMVATHLKELLTALKELEIILTGITKSEVLPGQLEGGINS